MCAIAGRFRECGLIEQHLRTKNDRNGMNHAFTGLDGRNCQKNDED